MSVQKSLLLKKSDADLHKYLEAENQFVSTAILYAFEILKSRGILFDQSEATRIDALISERIKSEYLPPTDEYDKGASDNDDDESLVALFSEKTVTLTAAFLNTSFAAILLAINLYRINKRWQIIPVLLVGIIVPLMQAYIFENIFSREYFYYISLIGNAIGVLILIFGFWRKIIHENVKYRKRDNTVALIVMVVTTIGLHLLKS